MSRIGATVVAAYIGLAAASFVRAQTLDVFADATTNSGSPTQISGPLPAITASNAGVCNGRNEATCRSFVTFDLSPLRSAPTVDKAVLRFWVTEVVAPGTVEVVPVLEPWREDTLTADASPTLGSPVASFDVAGLDAQHTIEVDVTTLVQDWVSGALGNHGLALVSSGSANVLFGTRSSHPPELVGSSGDTTPIGSGFADAGVDAGTWTPTATYSAPWPRCYHTAVWTGSRMIVWGGIGSSGLPFFTGGRYDPVTDSWTPTTIVGAPSGRNSHTAVWTGSRMIVWGGHGDGYLDTGARYDPVSDSWTPTQASGAPSARSNHTAVWTGARMIVWGGLDGGYLDTGAQYDPVSDSWTPIQTIGAPSARYQHTAVWTGSRMIVWGGYGNNGFNGLNTGSRYDPVANSWTATATVGAPSQRYLHTAVWTGSRMIVWGGNSGAAALSTGGRYDPMSDSWTATGTNGAPVGRRHHTAVWTGSRMIVWGGLGSNGDLNYLNTGGEYNPVTDSWTPTVISGAPSRRYGHTAIRWSSAFKRTPSKMIVWGGVGGPYLHTGARYEPLNALQEE